MIDFRKSITILSEILKIRRNIIVMYLLNVKINIYIAPVCKITSAVINQTAVSKVYFGLCIIKLLIKNIAHG